MTTTTSCFSIVAAFIIGLLMTLGIVANANSQQHSYNQTATAIQQTNWFVETAIHETETAKAWTPTPSSTPTVAK